LSGKYRRGMTAPPEGTRIETATKQGWSESWDTYDTEHTWTVLDALLSIAQESGKTPAQVALQWLLQRPGVTAPIIGARILQQLEDDLGAIGWNLADEQLSRLNEVSTPQKMYPYW